MAVGPASYLLGLRIIVGLLAVVSFTLILSSIFIVIILGAAEFWDIRHWLWGLNIPIQSLCR